MLKYAKSHGNWFRRFEDIGPRRCEPLNVVDYFSGLPVCSSVRCRFMPITAIRSKTVRPTVYLLADF